MEGKKHRDKDVPKDQEECDGCGYETRLLRSAQRPFPSGEVLWLCEVCRSTEIGNAALYPRQFQENAAVLKALGWGINAILAAIEAKT